MSVRTLIDPRVSARHVSNLTSRPVKLPGSLLLRAVLTIDLSVHATPATARTIGSTA